MSKVLKVFSVLLILAVLGFVAYYFLEYGTVAIVSDLSFSTNLKQDDFKDFKLYLFKNRYRLKWVELENLNLTDQQLFELQVSQLNKYDLLILSPVVTAFCDLYNMDMSSLLDHSLVVGLTKSDSGNFDIALDPSQPETDAGSVDYRARYAKPEAQYVLIPDFEASLDSYIRTGLDKTTKTQGTLIYEKRSLR